MFGNVSDCACRAVVAARATSAGPAIPILPMTSPVAGSTTSADFSSACHPEEKTCPRQVASRSQSAPVLSPRIALIVASVCAIYELLFASGPIRWSTHPRQSRGDRPRELQLRAASSCPRRFTTEARRTRRRFVEEKNLSVLRASVVDSLSFVRNMNARSFIEHQFEWGAIP